MKQGHIEKMDRYRVIQEKGKKKTQQCNVQTQARKRDMSGCDYRRQNLIITKE